MDVGVEEWQVFGDWVGGGEDAERVVETSVVAERLAEVGGGVWDEAEGVVSGYGEESEEEGELACVHFVGRVGGRGDDDGVVVDRVGCSRGCSVLWRNWGLGDE